MGAVRLHGQRAINAQTHRPYDHLLRLYACNVCSVFSYHNLPCVVHSMFTGLVQAVGVAQYDATQWRLRVTCEGFFVDVALGDSIAINGACMTVVEFAADWAAFDVMEESRGKTNLKDQMRYNKGRGGGVQ